MPPKLGEEYNASLYLVHEDGSYTKLVDIKDFDIGASEPPDGAGSLMAEMNVQSAGSGYSEQESGNSGTESRYSDTLLNDSMNAEFSLTMKTPLTRKQKCVLLGLSTKRDIRRAMRLAERMRRQEVKAGWERPCSWLTLAAMEIGARNSLKKTDNTVKENVKYE